MPSVVPPTSLPASGAPDATPTIFATGDETEHIFALVSITLPPHDPGLPLHCHPYHAEGCYVVAGTLALTQDGSTTIVTAHLAASIPAGALHTFWNPTASPTIVLLIYRPGVTEAEAMALVSGATGEPSVA